MTALMRIAERAPPRVGHDAFWSPEVRSWSFSREAGPFPLQCQGDAIPTPRVIVGLDGQALDRH